MGVLKLLVAASVVAGDAVSEVEGTSSVIGERGADGMRSCPELRERTGTSSSSRHVKEGEHKRGSIHRCKYVE